MRDSQYSFHADRWGSSLFASLWVDAWGNQYPVAVAPFSSCTNRLLQKLDQGLVLSPSKVLVDLGCGTGGPGLWLAKKKGVKLIGIDRCRDAISIATDRVVEWELTEPAAFSIGDFSETGLAPAVADAVISIDALPATQDIKIALSEVRRILKPNGAFVFTARELGPNSRHYKDLGFHWSKGLEQMGFDIVSISERPEVSSLWRNLYGQWLKNESGLRRELQEATVDALIEEAQRGIPKMNDERPWYLIKAASGA